MEQGGNHSKKEEQAVGEMYSSLLQSGCLLGKVPAGHTSYLSGSFHGK